MKSLILSLSTLLFGLSLFTPAQALVVKEQAGDVTIYRNVKTFTSSHVQVVRPKTVIGSSTLLRPDEVLRDEEITHCNRRLRTVDSGLELETAEIIAHGRESYCD